MIFQIDCHAGRLIMLSRRQAHLSFWPTIFSRWSSSSSHKMPDALKISVYLFPNPWIFQKYQLLFTWINVDFFFINVDFIFTLVGTKSCWKLYFSFFVSFVKKYQVSRINNKNRWLTHCLESPSIFTRFWCQFLWRDYPTHLLPLAATSAATAT